MQRGRCCRDRQARGPDNFGPNEISGMGRVLHRHGVCSFILVVVIQGSNRRSLVPLCRCRTSGGGYGSRRGSMCPCGRQSVCTPSTPGARASPRVLHVVEEGHHLAKLVHRIGWNRARRAPRKTLPKERRLRPKLRCNSTFSGNLLRLRSSFVGLPVARFSDHFPVSEFFNSHRRQQ
jgi:hypothetical protein